MAFLILGVLAVAVALGLRGVSGGDDGTLSGGLLPAGDASKLAITVAPVTSAAGLLNLSEALSAGARTWVVEPNKPEAFLQLVTDENTSGTDHPLHKTPVWIVRYSGLSVSAPGGGERFHFKYAFIDAVTGDEIFSKWAS